ncbi:hypothetical protein GP918_29425, partial [Enterobacteriaceae bacterium 8376wD7]|nr:hypothetical protein [Enterobacteriaceae bacterium 8376wD7]
MSALPPAWIQMLAGLALLGTIGGSLFQAVHQASERDAAVLTFLITASGVTLAGIGSAFWGVVLGFLVGHMFDRARSRRLNLFANQQERQSLFFSTTFEVMGHLTKSKGRVTEADIHVANVLMDRMNLHGASRTAAQQAF